MKSPSEAADARRGPKGATIGEPTSDVEVRRRPTPSTRTVPGDNWRCVSRFSCLFSPQPHMPATHRGFSWLSPCISCHLTVLRSRAVGATVRSTSTRVVTAAWARHLEPRHPPHGAARGAPGGTRVVPVRLLGAPRSRVTELARSSTFLRAHSSTSRMSCSEGSALKSSLCASIVASITRGMHEADRRLALAEEPAAISFAGVEARHRAAPAPGAVRELDARVLDVVGALEGHRAQLDEVGGFSQLSGGIATRCGTRWSRGSAAACRASPSARSSSSRASRSPSG